MKDELNEIFSEIFMKFFSNFYETFLKLRLDLDLFFWQKRWHSEFELMISREVDLKICEKNYEKKP